jgi:hypothetical protein
MIKLINYLKLMNLIKMIIIIKQDRKYKINKINNNN